VAALAVYTTVYPGVERFLADWHASVRRQTDADFRLWIGLDILSVDAARAAMGADPDAAWVRGRVGDTPGSLRQRALGEIVREHSSVVLVDSDDVLHPSRVATARSMLEGCDLAGCPLRVVDELGRGVGTEFVLPSGVTPDAVFPRTNVFGLSNSAVRADLLRRCLPIPDEAVLVDWFLFTRAWLFGARLGFGHRVEMDYRQHGNNTARVRAPFKERQVIEDTERVRAHYRLVLASDLAGALPDRLAEIETAAADVERFHERVVEKPALLSRYVEDLNRQTTTMVWWAWVAHPSLQHLWATGLGAE
jgi:hypothetical protein